MKKMIKKVIALTGCMYCLIGAVNSFGAYTEMEKIKQQVRQLLEQNQQLTRRITVMEKAQLKSGAAAEHAVSPIPERLLRTREQQVVKKELRKQMEEEHKEQKINDYVTLFGTIVAEAAVGDDYGGNSFSEFNMAEATLGFDVQISEWSVGHILAKYEGPDDNLFVDEANIWLGNYEKFPLLATAGKFYMPFGKFETNMIQDPMTLEIGEINDYGVAVGLLTDGFYGAVYGNNGMKEAGDDNIVKGFGVVVGYGFENDTMSVDGGVSWVNNIANSGGISDYFDDAGLETINSNVAGFGAHLLVGFGPVSFIGEYITALDDFAAGEVSFRNRGARPKAWNTEVAFTIEFLGKEAVFAVGVQGSSDSLALGLPYTRYIGAASMVLLPGTALTLEYFHDEDYDTGDGGTGENANVFTAQLAYEF